jgi:murein DD-endopeptidase MepM/ murein hydrolase activator NlpD
MPTFPLPSVPTQSYSTGPRRFGSPRSGNRLHAGCDLIAAEGTEIRAVEAGVVVRGPYPFYHGTHAIEVRHGTRIVRYCEIRGTAEGLGVGSAVSEGQVIAYVGRMYRDSMLHFEMYEGTATGQLTQRSNPPYQRRSDLMNPTDYLDRCAASLAGGP